MSNPTIRQDQSQSPSLKQETLQFVQGVGKFATLTVIGVSVLAGSVVTGGLVGIALSFRNLPDVRLLQNYSPTETSYIYDIKGRLLTRLHGEANREVVELDEVSPELKQAVLAIEDSHFYEHQGVNPQSVARALVANLQSGHITEGGSTITMQLVKNVFLSPDRTFSRKLAEAVLAVRLEQVFSKDEILEMYLNTIYWGHNNYGVETAAESYFQKSASELNLAEATMMAGLIQAPEQYSPFANYSETKRRQRSVLSRMEELGWITPQIAEDVYNEPLLVGKPTSWEQSQLPAVTEAVKAELREKFGEEALLEGGLRVQTSIDLFFQQMAEETVKEAHQNLVNRGLRADQVSIVAVDPRTHFVKAMVGSVDYDQSQFNRALQSRRQPGSAFKPFVYYSAFASGRYTPESSIDDSPVSYRDGSGVYRPRNYGGGFEGTMSLRRSLTQSRNIPAVKLGQEVGLDNVISVAQDLGIRSPLQPVTSLPLGSIGVTPLEMAGAYATLANNGWHSDPTFIVRVTDSEGNVLLDNRPEPELVLDEWATASVNNVLQEAVSSGTGTRAQLGRPVAGKTGTTDAAKDVWFVGYVPQMATAVWIGNDDNRPLTRGATGGEYAAPVWRQFMEKALENEPVQEFSHPSEYERPEPE
ncbi:penicillin-binding protein 1A [Euhalothece natronophila Z-M001]|uniref:Penicillin-binding protein 1A n=1 Tax=Euhalothece natronophila Z-M001 TaxID=522448 RepID=A0A5B8NP85_9CHRO|nr:penicillin-binding protein 1A [Euhalothece natronophila Z-M001]